MNDTEVESAFVALALLSPLWSEGTAHEILGTSEMFEMPDESNNFNDYGFPSGAAAAVSPCSSFSSQNCPIEVIKK